MLEKIFRGCLFILAFVVFAGQEKPVLAAESFPARQAIRLAVRGADLKPIELRGLDIRAEIVGHVFSVLRRSGQLQRSSDDASGGAAFRGRFLYGRGYGAAEISGVPQRRSAWNRSFDRSHAAGHSGSLLHSAKLFAAATVIFRREKRRFRCGVERFRANSLRRGYR